MAREFHARARDDCTRGDMGCSNVIRPPDDDGCKMPPWCDDVPVFLLLIIHATIVI